MDRFDGLRAFAATARAGSFAAGGRALGLTRDQMSKAIADLERRLGTPLFVRSTRSVQLTAAGALYLDRVEPLLTGLEEAEAELRQADATPFGRLIVHAPTSFGLAVLAPLNAGFLAAFPRIELEMCFEDRLLRPVPGEVDIAIRVGSRAEPGLAVERLGTVRRALWASPDYLARHAPPTTVEQLSAHPHLVYGLLQPRPEWVLHRDGEVRTITTNPLFASTTGLAVHAAALGGLGIAVLPDFLSRPSGDRLTRVLPPWEVAPLEILAMTHPSRRTAPKIDAYLHYLRRHLAPG